jgi:hypothetical protein
MIDVSVFEEECIVSHASQITRQIYRRCEDEVVIVVTSVHFCKRVENAEIEILINLQYPCITAPISFDVPAKSGCSQELKIARLYEESSSLAEVLSINPVWWTPTMKAKTIIGIVPGLRFAHSLGLLHGPLTAASCSCIQTTEFKWLTLVRSDWKKAIEKVMAMRESRAFQVKSGLRKRMFMLFDCFFLKSWYRVSNKDSD